ncbi:formin-binding protein 1-like isoform X2 [Varroa jacobsoni]|uniref:formin-binding protein 1-like isoform X2 n=1 Tax=Varroa jacobsoni TaxID=62625 RepID=UPI000BF25752|nr:formin-binding protein 1-like isoform X2 [Varroa jacobsoni]
MPSEVIRYGERKPFSYVHGTLRGDRWRGSQFLHADPYGSAPVHQVHQHSSLINSGQNYYNGLQQQQQQQQQGSQSPYYVVHSTAFGTISRDMGSRLNLDSIGLANSMHNVAAAGNHMIDVWKTDQYEKISGHTLNGVQFLENFLAFIKERSAIENEYADKLRKMARKYQPKKARQGLVEEDDTNFTTHLAFNAMLNEIADLAGQHEVISEVLVQNIAKEIASLVRELKDERKRLLAEGSKLQQNLQSCVQQMEKCQRSYIKAHRDAEKMQEKYERAENDMHLSRAEINVARLSSISKNQFCEESKAEYASQLQKTNELQRMHFNEYMPRVFSDLQQMDERRITCIQNFMKEVAQAQLKVNPIVLKCLNEIIAAADKIDPVKDSEMVVDKYKSGFFPPDDFPFETLSEEKTNGASLNYSSGGPHHKKETQRGTISSKIKKRTLLSTIFGPSNKNNLEDAKDETWSDLPPNQRRKKIQKRLNDIRDELAHETNQKDGLRRMRETYEGNSALGDPASLDAESDRCTKRIDSLHQQAQRYQSLLNEIESSTPDAVKRHSGHARGNSIISAEDTGSLSRSNSDESNIHNNSGGGGNYTGSSNGDHGAFNSESGVGSGSLRDIDDPDFDAPCNDGENEPLPPLGTAIALYTFQAENEGAISMNEQDEMYIVELDQGDGWTRVRMRNGNDEGFVPSSYLDITMYNTC